MRRVVNVTITLIRSIRQVVIATKTLIPIICHVVNVTITSIRFTFWSLHEEIALLKAKPILNIR